MQNRKKIWLIVLPILLISIVGYWQIKPSFSGCSYIQYRNPHPAPLQEKNIRFEDIVK